MNYMDMHRKKIKPVHVEENIHEEEQQMDMQESNIVDKPASNIVWGVFGVLILLGIFTGYLLSGQKGILGSNGSSKSGGTNSAGTTDTRVFKDSAEGVIEKGGIDGEGTHKLIREGGPSQTAYLISTTVDLDQFVGKKVKVQGQTVSAKKAAWLMDVGKIDKLSE